MRDHSSLSLIRIAIVVSVCLTPPTASADQSFTDEAAFIAALPPESTTVLRHFDDLAGCTAFGGCPLTSQYPNIEFSNATVWNWSASMLCGGNVTPPNNLLNSDVTAGGPIGFVFDTPVFAVGVYNASPGQCGTDAVQLTLYDESNAVLFQGVLHSTQVNFLGYLADGPVIARGEAVSAPPTNGAIFVDNLLYASPPIVPALSPLGLGTCVAAIVLVAAGAARRRWSENSLANGSGR